MHKVLKRQLGKVKLSEETLPKNLDQWQAFLERVHQTYTSHDEDRYLLERSIEISSREMEEKVEENKSMLLQLAQASKLSSLGTMASGIAHELNNPLTVIIGIVDLVINQGSGLSEKEKTQLEKVLKYSRRMSEIVTNLLKLSRKDSEDIREKVSLENLVQDAFEVLAKQLEDENIEVALSTSGENFLVEVNPNTFISVIQNLIINSRDAFSEKNCERKKIEIEIDAVKNDKFLYLSYKDNAGGMPEEVESKIYDPFFTTKETGKGTGLGMALCKQIVESYGGTIELSVEREVGSTFTIKMPYALNKDQESSTFQNINVKRVGYVEFKKKKKLLIVDDEEDILELLSFFFEAYFKVETCSNSNSASEMIDTNDFDYLFTDIRMPGIGGKKLGEKFLKKKKDAKIIYMSGHLDERVGKDLVTDEDQILFIQKPFMSKDELTQTVLKFLGHSPYRD